MAMPPGYPGEERGSDTWRLMLAVALIAGLWMLWPLLFPSPPPPDTPPVAASQPTSEDGGILAQATPLSAAGAPISGSAMHAPSSAPVRPDEAFVEVRSDVVHARLSTWGAAFVDFQLVEFEDEVKREKGKTPPPVDLVPGKGAGDRSFALRSTAGTFALPADAAYEVVEQAPEKVILRHDTGTGVVVTRSFRFDDSRYSFEVEDSFENRGSTAHSAQLELSVTGQERSGEREGGSMFTPAVDQMSWACRTDVTHRTLSAKHEKDETRSGTVSWAGIDRQFFLAAMVPREGQTASCSARRLGEHGLQVVVSYLPVTISPGQSLRLVSTGYFGPKQVDRLEKLQSNVVEAIDFGWFGVIARPMLWLLVMFYGWVHNYGLAIILLTFSVKLVLLPVTQKAFESAERMKKVQPLIKELQAKYKSDRMMLGQKQMELFKEHKVSPLGGCLPMALQMPIWIALYRTLYTSVELYQQPFIEGWIDNLAFKDPTYVLPILVTAFMLVQQFFTPLPQDNPSMKYMMWGMPIFFGFIMLQLPAGLGIYILINSVLTVIQQAYIRRKFGTKSPAATPAARAS
ncbi:MAG: membrane protein insertase YidC [Pseudomonadota bacterium]